MKRLKRWLMFILVLLVLVLILANLGMGGYLTGLFSRAVPASQMVAQPQETQIVIKEHQIYLNQKLIGLEQLEAKLQDLKSKTDQVTLKDEQAKRVTYKQVETLLQEIGFRTVKK